MSKLPRKLPKTINVAGTPYKIEYTDKASETDLHKRQGFLGQQDHWTSTWRVYAGKERTQEGIWKVIFHEMIHTITEEYTIAELLELPAGREEQVVDLLAVSLYDTLKRNKLIDF